MSLVICQSSVPCGNPAEGKCLMCGTLQCRPHLGPQPGSQHTAFYLWWHCCLTVPEFEVYQHVKAEIEQRWQQFPQTACIICRFNVIWSEFFELARQKNQEHQDREARHKALQAAREEWVRQNWKQILDHHRQQHQPQSRRISLFRSLRIWTVEWRDGVSRGQFDTERHYTYAATFITADNRVIEGNGEPVDFSPIGINSQHWLYTLAAGYKLIP